MTFPAPQEGVILERHGEGFETSPAPNRNGSYEDRVMAPQALPSPEVLRQLLRYEPDTGKLFWLPRGQEWFPDLRRKCVWNARYSGKEALTAISLGYCVGRVLDRQVTAHRVAWAIAYGNWPDLDIDHINRIRSDNRLCNLRLATTSENMRNRALQRNNTSGHKGVTAVGTKWQAQIQVHGESLYLGSFTSKAAASEAYASASAMFHGEFGRTV